MHLSRVLAPFAAAGCRGTPLGALAGNRRAAASPGGGQSAAPASLRQSRIDVARVRLFSSESRWSARPGWPRAPVAARNTGPGSPGHPGSPRPPQKPSPPRQPDRPWDPDRGPGPQPARCDNATVITGAVPHRAGSRRATVRARRDARDLSDSGDCRCGSVGPLKELQPR
jgi:hypothetical protein